MSHGAHDDEAALAELIATLRGAAPEGAELARIRRSVVSGARGGGGARCGSGVWVIAGVIALTLGGSSVEAERAVEVAPRASEVVPLPAPTATVPAGIEAPPAIDARTAIDRDLVRVRPRAHRVRSEIEPASEVGTERFDDTLALLAAPRAKSTLAAFETPSALHADALRAYAAGRCDEAMPLLQRVPEGETDDEPAIVERAELLLADCLARTGFDHAALALTDAIARRGPSHTQHGEALELVGRLALRAPDPDALAETVGLYGDDRLVALEGTPVRDVLVFLMARARYDAGDLEPAAALFARVSPGGRWYVPARYWEGVTHVRRHRARPAMDAFQAVLDAAGTERDGARGERAYLRDLASIAMARVAYTAARPAREDADAARQTALLERALEAWQRVELGSTYGVDAFFEESWALYLLGENARALGHVHGLLSPQLEDHAPPEALVLRATIYYEHCRLDAAERAVADFHARYDALLEQVAARERSLDDADAAFALLDDVRSERGPDGVLGRALRALLSDRALVRQLIRVRSIDAEIARVSSASFARTSLAERVSQELAIVRALAATRAGETTRARIARLADDLRARANEIDTVQLEIDTARRREAETGVPITREPERGTRIVAVQGDQIWPFDGEYWDDELPYYREQISSICAR